ncbi:hypothetical protein K5X82_13600 [Halosquirtibacter xylanolyticus]|uniref:hypothetical protein n=1 Tax=Halosquirtibacter xylanolyticus TaxID=3374599 RepID=UPI003749D3DD|nr:hypothetical protein K5X82_13600 [Prolixibacteraceae bacterium]
MHRSIYLIYGHLWLCCYEKRYYRIAEHGLDKELVKKTRYKYWLYKQITILVLNDKFEVIAEKKREPGKYKCRSFYVGKDGFYVQRYHPDDPNISEDQFTIDRFQLVKRDHI